MKSFVPIYERACRRKGGPDALETLLPVPSGNAELEQITGERALEEIARRIFQAGFVWRVVDDKWPGITAALHGFDPVAIAHMSNEALEALLSDERLIRNHQKLASIRHNASFVLELEAEHGSFGTYIAEWPVADIIGLHRDLARRGARLGGLSGQWVLRALGKDTFVLSWDTVAALERARIIDSGPASMRAQNAIQTAFNEWSAETGRPLCQISRILSMSID